MITDKQQVILAIISANVIFGLNTPVTRSLMSHWMTPIGYTTSRMLFGTLAFWLIGLCLKKEKVAGKDTVVMLVGGLLGFFGIQFLFSQSLRYTTPVVFSLLMALTPVTVLLISAVFLKESVTGRKVLGILLSVFGACLIIISSYHHAEKGSDNSLGILFAILCVLCYSGYLVLTRKISGKYHSVTIAKWMFAFSALLVLPFSFSELHTQRIYSQEATILAISLLSFALLFSTTLAFFLMPVGLKRLEASTVSIFMNLQPLVASVVAIAIGQDMFSWNKPLATLFVLGGVFLVTTKKPAAKNE